MQHNGIHHVTAIAGPARRNHDFYTAALGLRLVKKTVNFDDPKTYHFYYGDETGLPGSIVTHFPWEHAAQGRVGPGETHEVQLRVPLPEASRLRRPPRAAYEASGSDRDALVALASVVENNVERLNALRFTYLDYAVVAKRA